jgi:prepilin-type N-terminal cleavage/methylation domain-containing protein
LQISTRISNPGSQLRITAPGANNRGFRGLPPIHDSRFTIHQHIRAAFTLIELPCHAVASAKAGRRTKATHNAGFTLIELLVVIVIIAVLAGLLFPAINGAQNQAKKVQAKNDLIQVVTAVNAFYTEYGKYPLATADTIYGPEGVSNADLFYTLRAVASGANASNAVNTRQIVFISPPNVKDQTQPKSGIAPVAVTVNGISIPIGSLVDPWGTPYNVKIDGDYNNQVTNPYPDTDGSAGANPLGFGVIGWSYGRDQTKGSLNPSSPNFKNSDDVISWQ